jgi:hypothetical protein
MSTANQKLIISASSAFLFTLINSPQTYKITNSLTELNLYENCPTNIGIVIHTIIFFVLTFLSMTQANASIGTKLKHSIYGTLIFYIISSPPAFALLNTILGDEYADINGCPTIKGILLNALTYCSILFGIMYLP